MAHCCIVFAVTAAKKNAMYQFKIKELADGGFKFELNDIKMLVDGYRTDGVSHVLKNPAKAIAYINNGDNMYGISNQISGFKTAEELHDAVTKQFQVLKSEPQQKQNNHQTKSQKSADTQEDGLKLTA